MSNFLIVFRHVRVEADKIFTIRHNFWLASVCLVLSGILPWVFIAGFEILKGQGLPSSPLEVLSFASAMQIPANTMMVLLGIRTCLPDLNDGTMAAEFSALGRKSVIFAKLLLGLAMVLVTGFWITLSTLFAWLVLGGGTVTVLQEEGLAVYWFSSYFIQIASLGIYFVFGLVLAALTRSRSLAITIALGSFWIFLPALEGAMRAIFVGQSDFVFMFLPMKASQVLASSTPGGNSLVVGSPVASELLVLVCVLWIVFGIFGWVRIMITLPIYPSDILSGR